MFFVVVFFLFVSCSEAVSCLPPRERLSVVSCGSDHAGPYPKGRGRCLPEMRAGPEFVPEVCAVRQEVRGSGELSSQVPCSTEYRPCFGRKKEESGMLGPSELDTCSLLMERPALNLLARMLH